MTDEQFQQQLQDSHEKYKLKYEELKIQRDLVTAKANEEAKKAKTKVIPQPQTPEPNFSQPTVDALADIKAGNPMYCSYAEGIAGFKPIFTHLNDDWPDDYDAKKLFLKSLPCKYSGGPGCVHPIKNMAERNYYVEYNDTILRELFKPSFVLHSQR